MFGSAANCRIGGLRNNLRPDFLIRLFLRTWWGAFSLAVVSFAACTHDGWRILSTDSEPRTLPISAIAFTDRDRGWAVTATHLLETNNGGVTWNDRMAAHERIFHSVTFVNPKTGWVVGSEPKDGNYVGLILHTTDGGINWQEKVISSILGLTSVSFCDENFGWAVGPEVIVSTSDGGKSWEVRYRGEANRKLLGIECVTHESAWVVGENGTILHTEDAGKTWGRQDAGVSSTLMRARFFGNDGWILGSEGTLLRTKDGGATWGREKLDVTGMLCDIHIMGLQGWVVGSQGTILYSSDGGNAWHRKKSPTDEDLYCLSFLDSVHGWAAGERKIVLGFSE
jgi:photosystem II stability/assembly factor-like uncharacterized protein